MSVRELLLTLAPHVAVRIRVVGCKTLAGETGALKTRALLDALSESGIDTAYVTCIYPLHHARELYIEALRC